MFWLSARGLRRLYGSPREWGEAVHRALAGQGWQAVVVAGFGHFTTQVIAKGVGSMPSPGPHPSLPIGKATLSRFAGEGNDARGTGGRSFARKAGEGALRSRADESRADRVESPVHVFTDPAQERQAAARVPLERCGLTVDELEALTQLGLRRLGDLLRLPPEGLLQRFGPRLYRLHRLATGTLQDPLQPQAERLPVRDWIFLEPPEDDTERLLFRIKARLPFLLAPLAARREALHTLRLDLLLDDHTRQTLSVQPAQPTRQERLILELVRLRLERPLSSPALPAPPASIRHSQGQARGDPPAARRAAGSRKAAALTAGIVEIVLEAEGRPREIEQPVLLGQTARRDLAAANRALAQLRAEFGEQAVVRAVPRQGHLPEARFAWEPLQRLEQSSPAAPARGRRPSPSSVAGASRRRTAQTPSPSPLAAGGWSEANRLGQAGGKQGEEPHPALTAGASGKPPQAAGTSGKPPQVADASGKPPALVRRMLTRPLPLPGWPRDATRWTQGRSPDADGLLALHGPYVISGGWWAHEQERDYYLAETAKGDVQWLYHDRRRGRWFCQGWVE